MFLIFLSCDRTVQTDATNVYFQLNARDGLFCYQSTNNSQEKTFMLNKGLLILNKSDIHWDSYFEKIYDHNEYHEHSLS